MGCCCVNWDLWDQVISLEMSFGLIVVCADAEGFTELSKLLMDGR